MPRLVPENSSFSTYLNNVTSNFSLGFIKKEWAKVLVGLPGIDGFTFSVAKDHEVTLSSAITDYPIEDGTVTQNVITLNPETVKLTGLVGEVVLEKNVLQETASFLSSSLAPIASLSPSLCEQTTKIESQLNELLGESAMLLKQVQNITKSVTDSIGNFGEMFDSEFADYKLTLQQKAFSALYTIWKNRKLVAVETPWGYWDDMVIEDLKFTQSEQSTTISDIEVSLKKITSPTVDEKGSSEVREGRNQAETDNSQVLTAETGLKETTLVEDNNQFILPEEEEIYVDAFIDNLAIRGDLE